MSWCVMSLADSLNPVNSFQRICQIVKNVNTSLYTVGRCVKVVNVTFQQKSHVTSERQKTTKM